MKIILVSIFSFVLILLSIHGIYSQNVKDQVLLDSAGFVYVIGQTKCSQDSDIAIIKYNQTDGALIWQKKMGLSGNSFFKSAEIKGSYLYIAALNNISGNKRLAVIRSDFAGNTISRFFDRPGGDYGNSLTTDNSGNFYVAGRTDLPLNAPKFLVVKYNSNLDSLWSYIYNGPLAGLYDEAVSCKTDQQGNVYVTGYTSQGQVSYDSYDYLTIKVSSAGILQWAKRYNNTVNKQDLAVALAVDTSANVYVTGFTSTGNGSNYFTIKYNSNGDSLASVSYNCHSSTINQPTAISIDNSGSVYVTGFGQCDANNNFDYITVKYNSSLSLQWNASIAGSGNNTPKAMKYLNSFVYVTGESDSSSGSRRFLTAKYNSSTGSEVWRWFVTSSDSNYASSVTVDNSDNVFVSGYSLPDTIITTKYTGWLSRYGYCPPFGINLISTTIPQKFSLLQNYPNPFNPATIIKFDISRKANVKITIYDALGKEIEEIINKELTPGTYEAIWDGTNFTSGIYFIQFSAGDYSDTKKMVLLK